MKSLLKDLVALVVFLSIGGTAGYVFYLDRTLEPEYVGELSVGRITSLKNESVRIPGDRTIELRLRKTGNVYLYETIKVNKEKGSSITFQLDPEFYHTDSELTLYEGTIIKFTPEGFRTEGKISLREADGSVRDVEGSFQAKVGTSGITFEAVRVSLITPVDGEFLSRELTLKIPFRWSEDRGLTQRILQIAPKPDFERILQEIPVPEDLTEVTADLPPGTWYWRIKATAEGREYVGPESLFTVYRYREPVVIDPRPDQTVTWWNRLALDLSWEESAIETGAETVPAERYQLEVTLDGSWSDFKPVLLGQKTRYRLTEELLGTDGTYRIRITPAFPFLNELRSANEFRQIVSSGRAESSFTVEKSADIRPLKLEYPADNAEFNTLEVRNGVSFNWEKDREIDYFRVSLAKDPEFADMITEESVAYFNWVPEKNLSPGRYYWKVSGVFQNGNARDSGTRSFLVRELEGNISLLYPAGGTLLELDPQDPAVNFRWQSDLSGAGYRILLYRDNEEKPFLRENVDEPLFTMNLVAPRKYRWQVQVTDPLGRTIKESALQSFDTGRPFRSPLMVYPPESGTVDLIGERELTLIWEKIGGADNYLFELYPVTDGIVEAEPVVKTETREPLLKLKDLTLLRSGDYEIRLASRRNNPPEGLIPVTDFSRNPFTVGELVFYTPPTLLSPANGAGFDLLRVRREGLKFSWTRPPKMEAFQLEIYSTNNTFDPVKTIRTTETGIPVRELSGGEYLWRIRGFDDKGREAPVSPFGRFTIGAVPRLVSPEIRFPLDGSGVNMELYDSLVVSWAESPGAEYYILTLYDLKKDRKITEQTVKTTRFEFTDLEQLDVGTFYVEVQAFRENRDVNPPLIQASTVVRSTFSLFLKETYEKPNIISPGIQYTR